MEEIANNIKEKLSTDNLVEMMKNAKVIDNDRVKEEDVRKTLETIDINRYVHVEELAEKLNKITEEAAASENNVTVTVSEKRSIFSVLSKSNDSVSRLKQHSDEDYMIKDNVTGFLD